ncbi:MAG: cell division protein SepF [Clostridia bacterium]|nr:cell division protein SepF [Clostridia bacterium]
MFEELLKKFKRQDEAKPEEAEFKPFIETTGNPTTPSITREEIEEQRHESAAATIEAKSESVELKVIRPESYADVAGVADSLLAGCTVVLNVEALDRPTVGRMLDFINGVTYCTDGEIKKVAKTTFIITPHTGVDVSDL